MSHRYYTRDELSRRGRKRTVRVEANVFELDDEWFWRSTTKGSGGPHSKAKHAKLAAGFYMRRRGWAAEGKWS